MREYEVDILTADGAMDTFVCHPEEGGPFPSVIIYMDAPGIREELRDMARRIGTVGYHVLLPNLYYRIGREGGYGFDLNRIRIDDGEMAKLYAAMHTLSNAGVIADAKALLDFLSGADAAADGSIGCVGYCMSGQFVVSVAGAYPDRFGAIASYYGVGLITEADDSPHLTIDKISGELYLAFASDDPEVPLAVVEGLPAVLAAAGGRHRLEIYPRTQHGFAFPQRAAYDKPAAERHWERMFALFDRRLRP